MIASSGSMMDQKGVDVWGHSWLQLRNSHWQEAMKVIVLIFVIAFTIEVLPEKNNRHVL